MRRRASGPWLGIFLLALMGNAGLLPAQGSDPADTPNSPSSPSKSFPSASTEQEKAEHRRQAMHGLNQACGADMKKFCRHVQPGGGHIVECLELIQSDLSPDCSQWLNKLESEQGSKENRE